jgi:hypothetical protein
MKERMIDRRTEHRFLCSDIVQVSWIWDGRAHEEHTNMEDVSPSGCRLLMDQAVAESTPIDIRCGEHLFRGAVRYCRQTEIGFDIGVQFTQPGAWDREEFEPKHLLDARSLQRKPDSAFMISTRSVSSGDPDTPLHRY